MSQFPRSSRAKTFEGRGRPGCPHPVVLVAPIRLSWLPPAGCPGWPALVALPRSPWLPWPIWLPTRPGCPLGLAAHSAWLPRPTRPGCHNPPHVSSPGFHVLTTPCRHLTGTASATSMGQALQRSLRVISSIPIPACVPMNASNSIKMIKSHFKR
jgi:hypothetical protein